MGFSRPEYWSGEPFPSSGNVPNPGIKPTSLALQADSLPTEPQGSPRIVKWEAYPFSSGSSQPRSWTGVSCIAGRFFTNWATREALMIIGMHISFWITVLSGYMLRSGNAGSYGNSIFSFLRSFHTVSHSGCTNLHFLQGYKWVPKKRELL